MNKNNKKWILKKKFKEVLYFSNNEISKIVINRSDYRNSFTPLTIFELYEAFIYSLEDKNIGIIILTGSDKLSFCSGGDQNYRYNEGYLDNFGINRLNVLDLQRLIRSSFKPVVAVVCGGAVGGGNILQLLCDITIASDNSYFMQTGPKVGSFDGGFGACYLSRVIGQKRARDFWFTCRIYNSYQALDFGLINYVFPLKYIEKETLKICNNILKHSKLSIRCLKASLNADCDGQYGLQELAGCATLLFYNSRDSKNRKNNYIKR